MPCLANRNGILLLFFLGLCAASSLTASPYTPPIWRETAVLADGTEVHGKLVHWNRDKNHNFIDDLIDQRIKAGGGPFDVIVALNRCVTCDKEAEDEVVKLLKRVGTLDYMGRYLTFAVVLGVSASDVALLAGRDEVAMVESLEQDRLGLDVSVAAIRGRASSAFSPNTLEEAFPGLTGAGGSIAIIDSGVDNAGGPGITHDMFPAGIFVGGANCIDEPCTIGDPDDDNGHGSHLAGIALGRFTSACGGPGCRGVAPGAMLVDIKSFNSVGSSVGSSALRGVELAIAQREAWNIKVLNLSFGTCQASDGRDTRAQLANTAVSHGLVVVVAVLNAGNCSLPNGSALINSWAAASLAITVASANDGDTVELPDTISAFSLRGPRFSDGDGDPTDEMKPEISAPGEQILSAQHDTTNGFIAENGTSMAAPHVAGAAALLLQASPGMNPGSVKEVLLQTAAQSGKPGPHPGWNNAWGFGFLDLYAAMSRAQVTDVGRPTEPPYAPCTADWCSPHISTASEPRINQATTISAQVTNHGASQADNVRVCFGIYVFSNNSNLFHELECRYVSIPGSTTQTVSIPWVPQASLIPDGFPPGQALHACIKVSIDYAFDTVTTNNDMQRNTSIATASIARVPFRLQNDETEPVTVRLNIKSSNTRWSLRFFEKGKLISRDTEFFLQPQDCPRDLIIELEPDAGAPAGDRTEVSVQAVTAEGKDFGGILIQGIHLDHSKPGALTGRVIDSEGKPLRGVTVKAEDGRGTQSASTATDGTYRLSLLSGEYKVAFELAGCLVRTRLQVTVDPERMTALNDVILCGEARRGI